MNFMHQAFALHSSVDDLQVIRVTDRSLDAEVKEYVAAHPQSEMMHLPVWDEIISVGLKHAVYRVIARENGKIVGTCGLTHIRSPLFGNRLISIGAFTGGGILCDHAEAGEAILQKILKFSEDLGVDITEMRESVADNPAYANDQRGIVRDGLYASFVKELPKTPEEILLVPGRKKRADVRKGIDNKALSVHHDASFDEFMQNYALTLKNHGTPSHYKKFYKYLIETLARENAVNLTCVRYEGKAVAAVCSFLYKETLIAYYGGADPLARKLHAFDYMYYELMCYARKNEFRFFDFGRSKVDSGGYAYKHHWRFDPQPLAYRYYPIKKDKIPDISPKNPKYALPIKLWQKAPAFITDALGGYIARQIG